jgi:hypothetical protein
MNPQRGQLRFCGPNYKHGDTSVDVMEMFYWVRAGRNVEGSDNCCEILTCSLMCSVQHTSFVTLYHLGC